MSPLARTADPITSHEAAASVTVLRVKQQCVLDLFRVYGEMTDQELEERYKWAHRRAPRMFPKQSESGLRTRRAELVDLGLVEFANEYGLTAGNRRTRRWRAL